MPSLTLPYDSIVNPNMPVIAEEMKDAHFTKTAADGIGVRFDPASNVTITDSLDGIKIDAPAAPPSDVTTWTWDGVGHILTIAVDGQPPQTVNLSSLDDEGASLVINGQNLELQDEDGNVLSSTPITAIDAQQLSAAMNGAAWEVTLTNGGTVALTCAEVHAMFAQNNEIPEFGINFLADDCTKYSLKAMLSQIEPFLPSLTSTQLDLTQGGNITLGSQGTLTFNPLDCAAIGGLFPSGTGALLASEVLTKDCQSYAISEIVGLATSATTNTLVVDPVAGTITSTVNGVDAAAPLSDIVNCATIEAAYGAAAAPAAGDEILGKGCKALLLEQDVSSTGILMPTWSVRS